MPVDDLYEALQAHGPTIRAAWSEEAFPNASLSKVRMAVEQRDAEYFSKLELPDHPTIYDYRLLSLRKKDVIATFNWDPFLWLACHRKGR